MEEGPPEEVQQAEGGAPAPEQKRELPAKALATILIVFLAIIALALYLFVPALLPGVTLPGLSIPQLPPIMDGAHPTPTAASTATPVPTPTPFAARRVKLQAEEVKLPSTNATVSIKRTMDVTKDSYRAVDEITNTGNTTAEFSLLYVFPKDLLADALTANFSERIYVIERDPIVMQYNRLIAGQTVQREVRLPTGGQDKHYLLLVLEQRIDINQDAVAYTDLVLALQNLTQYDLGALNEQEVADIQKRLNTALNSAPIAQSVAAFSKEVELLQVRYSKLKKEVKSELSYLLELSELIPLAEAKIPNEYIYIAAGLSPNDTTVLNYRFNADYCQPPAVCTYDYNRQEEAYLINVDFRKKLEQGRLPEEVLNGSLQIMDPRRPGELKNLTVNLKVNRIQFKDYIHVAPKLLIPADNNTVFVANNLFFSAKLEGCGLSVTLSPRSVTKLRLKGTPPCELKVFDETVAEMNKTAKDSDINTVDLPDETSWDLCADYSCSCTELPLGTTHFEAGIISMVEDRFMENARFVALAHANAKGLIQKLDPASGGKWKETFLFRTREDWLDACILPADLAPFYALAFKTLKPGVNVEELEEGFEDDAFELKPFKRAVLSIDMDQYIGLELGEEKANYANWLGVEIGEVE